MESAIKHLQKKSMKMNKSHADLNKLRGSPDLLAFAS